MGHVLGEQLSLASGLSLNARNARSWCVSGIVLRSSFTPNGPMSLFLLESSEDLPVQTGSKITLTFTLGNLLEYFLSSVSWDLKQPDNVSKQQCFSQIKSHVIFYQVCRIVGKVGKIRKTICQGSRWMHGKIKQFIKLDWVSVWHYKLWFSFWVCCIQIRDFKKFPGHTFRICYKTGTHLQCCCESK